jgi:hypothetical protein
VNDKGEAVAGDTVKEEKEKAIQAIQKNQEMMQVQYLSVEMNSCV